MKIEELHRLFLECSSMSTDTRKIADNDMYFALKGDTYNGNKFAQDAIRQGAKYAIIDEDEYYSSQTILVDNVLETLQKLATFHRNYLKIPIIAITGSNGKTTTKELINAVLSKKFKTAATKGNLNNHIGVPITLLSMNNTTEIGIVEMGANHQKEIEFLCKITHPDFGYITNFGKAHLEGFGGVEGVIKGKAELYKYLIEYDKIIFVNDQDHIQLEKTVLAKTVFFGSKLSKIPIEFNEASPFVKLTYHLNQITSQLIGEYNFNNISAAIAIGNYFEVDDIDIISAIENYVPTNNRSQIITKGTNKIILDAYNANPTSMKAALLNFHQLNETCKIAILGDMFELGIDAPLEHQAIADLTISLSFDKIILVGENFFKSKINSEKVIQYYSFDDFKDDFGATSIKNATFLIKGSRGMALERVLDFIKK